MTLFPSLRAFALAVALLLLLVPAVSQALSVVYVPFEELVHQSDAVVIATVVDESYGVLMPWNMEVTDTRVEVEEVLYGEVPATLSFRKIGGPIPVPGVESFVPEERCVIFLRKGDDGAWWVTAVGQSKMELVDGPAGEIATRKMTVSAYVRDEAGELVSYVPRGEPRLLPTLRTAIQTAGASR